MQKAFGGMRWGIGRDEKGGDLMVFLSSLPCF